MQESRHEWLHGRLCEAYSRRLSSYGYVSTMFYLSIGRFAYYLSSHVGHLYFECASWQTPQMTAITLASFLQV